MKLFIIAPYDLTIQHIKRKYQLFMDIAAAEIMEKRYASEFLTEEAQAKENRNRETMLKTRRANGFNKKYTFDTFVVGENNRFAHASALAVAEMLGEAYNPLYIHGGPGLGKTHLVKAVAHYISQNMPEIKVIYTTSEKFTNEVIEAIRRGG